MCPPFRRAAVLCGPMEAPPLGALSPLQCVLGRDGQDFAYITQDTVAGRLRVHETLVSTLEQIPDSDRNVNTLLQLNPKHLGQGKYGVVYAAHLAGAWSHCFQSAFFENSATPDVRKKGCDRPPCSSRQMKKEAIERFNRSMVCKHVTADTHPHLTDEKRAHSLADTLHEMVMSELCNSAFRAGMLPAATLQHMTLFNPSRPTGYMLQERAHGDIMHFVATFLGQSTPATACHVNANALCSLITQHFIAIASLYMLGVMHSDAKVNNLAYVQSRDQVLQFELHEDDSGSGAPTMAGITLRTLSFSARILDLGISFLHGRTSAATCGYQDMVSQYPMLSGIWGTVPSWKSDFMGRPALKNL